MRNYSSIQFWLGQATPEPVSGAAREFHKWIAQVVAGDACELSTEVLPDRVPISNRAIGDATQAVLIYNEICAAFDRSCMNSSVFVVDVDGSPGLFRGHLALNLAQAINASVNGLVQKAVDTTPHVIALVLPELPPSEESSYLCLAEHLRSGRVVIFAHNGDINAGSKSLTAYSKEQFRLKFTTSRGDPSDILTKKMVFRLGHFQRKTRSGKQVCSRHFYDGRFCEKEICRLLESLIFEICGEAVDLRVLFHCPLSPWLINPVLAVGNRLGLKIFPFGRKCVPRGVNAKSQRSSLTLLVLDFVGTGQTLGHILDSLKEQGESLERVRIVSVLATNPTESARKVRSFHHAGVQFEIRYMMQAEQDVYREGECPMCKMEIPTTPADTESYRMLASYDHWEMCIQAGLKNEENIPMYRRPLPYVVDYPKMISLYGAWLAAKVRGVLSSQPGGFPADAVIVSPEHESGSQVLTDYLKMILEVTVIRVPRGAINAFVNLNSESKAALALIREECPPWYRNLVSSSQYDIVLMDEFNASGQTLHGLRNLLTHIGKSAQCYFVLNDLNPMWSDQQHVPVYSLYRWQSFSNNLVASD